MTSGIYEIVNRVTGQRYIGSSQYLEYRLSCHRFYLSEGTHFNPHLQNAWKKYGEEAFRFGIIEECEESLLLDREQSYLDRYWGEGLFNLARSAGAPMRGRTHSEESRRRMSESRLGKTGKAHTEEFKRKLREANLGKTFSEETRRKMAESQQRRRLTETKITRSEETREKMREAHRQRRLASGK